jgi:hypothetical protein
MKKYISSLSIVATLFLFGCNNFTNYEHNINSFIAVQNPIPMVSIDTVGAIDFRYLNDEHIALTVQNSKSYLLTMPVNCQNLYSTSKIILATSVEGVVQVNHRDKVVRVGDKYTECLVTGIYKLQPEQLKLLVSWAYKRHPSWSNNLIYPTFNDAKRRGISH